MIGQAFPFEAAGRVLRDGADERRPDLKVELVSRIEGGG